jgi:filamentous hemagglutinin
VAAQTWHFYRSPFTGRIGPSAALAQALLDAGITIVLHF